LPARGQADILNAMDLRDFQQLIEKMYSHKDRARGPAGTFVWLVEEIGAAIATFYGSDPRQSLKWVAFQKPVYGGGGASVLTEIMHGPLAGIGYECRLISDFAGWTVGECRTSWVS
jgi:hypothetical protein